jgi:hypothetical protein
MVQHESPATGPHVVLEAQLNLGALLARAGEMGRALQLLGAAVESGNPDIVPVAQASMGMLLARAGEPERARQLLKAAIKSGNSQAVQEASDLLAD